MQRKAQPKSVKVKQNETKTWVKIMQIYGELRGINVNCDIQLVCLASLMEQIGSGIHTAKKPDVCLSVDIKNEDIIKKIPKNLKLYKDKFAINEQEKLSEAIKLAEIFKENVTEWKQKKLLKFKNFEEFEIEEILPPPTSLDYIVNAPTLENEEKPQSQKVTSSDLFKIEKEEENINNIAPSHHESLLTEALFKQKKSS